jgi:hypothetical protein
VAPLRRGPVEVGVEVDERLQTSTLGGAIAISELSSVNKSALSMMATWTVQDRAQPVDYLTEAAASIIS